MKPGQKRKALFLIAGIIVFAVGWLIFTQRYRPSSVPVGSIVLLDYTNVTIASSNRLMRGNWLRARIMFTNEGSTSIEYPFFLWDAQTTSGKTNGTTHPPFTTIYGTLPAHSFAIESAYLPTNTLYWQCTTSVSAASLRLRAFTKLNTFWDRIYPVSRWVLQLLPNQPGPTVEFKSRLFQVETNYSGQTPNGSIPPK